MELRGKPPKPDTYITYYYCYYTYTHTHTHTLYIATYMNESDLESDLEMQTTSADGMRAWAYYPVSRSSLDLA